MTHGDEATRADLSVPIDELVEASRDANEGGDDGAGDVDARYDPAVDDSLTAVIVGAVARAVGCEPLEVEPLYDVLDPDALESLFEPCSAGPRSGSVSFVLEGVRVTVVDGTRVRVEEA
ncbi:HalOD1 output domain-containing protein [Natrialbaceae archaeon GCM10025810]|uniref:HalOD1 output domain-containing protein n=1 Tax=Halovalidus salilacus TaxID=3075124 RepID=UPI00360C3A0A